MEGYEYNNTESKSLSAIFRDDLDLHNKKQIYILNYYRENNPMFAQKM